MREGTAAILVAGCAQLGDRISFGVLGMGVMAGLALDSLLPMDGGSPLIGSGFMAVAAQVSIGCDGHGRIGMGGLERSVAGFACNPGFGIFTRLRIKTGSVALKTRNLTTQLGPIPLEDWSRESLGMACILPFGMDVLVALSAGLGTCISWNLVCWFCRRCSSHWLGHCQQGSNGSTNAKHNAKYQPATVFLDRLEIYHRILLRIYRLFTLLIFHENMAILHYIYDIRY
jgi:hypothetical protein